MKKGKNYNIEFLRVLSCFLVVCIHVANYYSRSYGKISEGSYIFSIIINGASRIAVPIFFMISGALLIDETPRIKKSVRRVGNIFFTLVVWSVIYYVWNLWYRNQPYDFRLLFAEPVKRHLWFLYALLGMYITLPFWQCMLKNMPKILMKYFVLLWFLFLTVNYILALCHLEITYQIPLVGTSCYLGYFIMGYVVKCLIGEIHFKKRACLAIAGVASALTVLVTYLSTVEKGVHVECFLEYRNILMAISATGVFVAVMKDVNYQFTGWKKKWIDLISKHSFTIYLAHILFLDIVKKEMNPRGIPAWVGIPVFSVGVFLVTLLFSVVVHCRRYCSRGD